MTHRWDHAIGLPFPERDVPVGLDHNMACFSGGFGSDNAFDALDLAGERLPGTESIEGNIALLKLQRYFFSFDRMFNCRSCRRANCCLRDNAKSCLTSTSQTADLRRNDLAEQTSRATSCGGSKASGGDREQ